MYTENMKTEIFIVRHGQTAMNHAKLLQGRSDIPLNETGIRQAEKTGDYFVREGIHFDHVFSSPLHRAVETAEAIVKGACRVETDERLLEMDYGPYEGISLVNPPEEITYFFSDFTNHAAPEGMEQLASVVKRLGEFLEEIRSSHLSGNILISTHAIAMKGALEYLSPKSHGSYWSKYIGNCAVYVSELDETGYSVPFEVNTESRQSDG